jgi:hypothetical protein
MNEAALLTAVTCGTRAEPGLCARYRLWWHHERDSRGTTPGWVDLVILGRLGAIFAELKGPFGTRSPAQVTVGYSLEAIGLNYQLWTPRDLASGRIERELAAIAGHVPVSGPQRLATAP